MTTLVQLSSFAMRTKNSRCFGCGNSKVRPDWSLPIKNDKALLLEGRGSMDVKFDKENDIIACKWAGNKTVCLASTYIASEPVGPSTKVVHNSKTKDCYPAASNSAGVQLTLLRLVDLYKINFKVKRYYMRIIMHLINAWLIYRRDLAISHFKTNATDELQKCSGTFSDRTRETERERPPINRGTSSPLEEEEHTTYYQTYK